jgi:hypothetical protein
MDGFALAHTVTGAIGTFAIGRGGIYRGSLILGPGLLTLFLAHLSPSLTISPCLAKVSVEQYL